MSVLQAFSAARKTMSLAKPVARGNIILKPTEFTAKTVKGEVLSGPAKGDMVEITVPNNGGKSVGIKDFTNPKSKAYVDMEKGGTLRVEKVRPGDDGVSSAKWMKTFNGVPQENHALAVDAVVELVKQGEDVFRMNRLMIEDEKVVRTVDDLRDAIRAGFETTGHVTLFCEEADGSISSAPFKCGNIKQGDEWVALDAAERADEVIQGFGEHIESVKAILEERGFSVVPHQSIKVGSDVAVTIVEKLNEEKENGSSTATPGIDPANFRVLPLGVRIQIALATQGNDALPKEAGDKLKERFLSYADDTTKAAFHKSGWRGVSDTDIRGFFADQGVSLRSYDQNGWTRQSLLLLVDGEEPRAVIKSFGQDAAVPYPNVKACENANKAFRTELKEGIESVIGTPAKKVEAEAPKAAEAAAAAAAEAAADEVDDLDAMLDAVEDADLDPQA